MSEQNIQKRIKQKNRNQKRYGSFHEEDTDKQENKNEDNYNDTPKYSFKKMDSSSSLGNKTIHKHHSSKNIILKMNEIINDYPEKYYKKHLKSDWMKFFINLFVSLLHIVIFFLYVNSLNACSQSLTLNECIEKIDINYYYKVYLLCFISAFLISFILVLMIAKFTSIYHSIFIILELIIFISINHQNNIFKNGLFSFRLLLIFMVITFLFLLFFVFFLIKLFKKHYFYSVFFFFAFL